MNQFQQDIARALGPKPLSLMQRANLLPGPESILMTDFGFVVTELAKEMANEIERLEANNAELLAALEDVESEIGWRGEGVEDSEKYHCEFCHQSHKDAVQIQHDTKCVVTQTRTAIANAKVTT